MTSPRPRRFRRWLTASLAAALAVLTGCVPFSQRGHYEGDPVPGVAAALSPHPGHAARAARGVDVYFIHGMGQPLTREEGRGSTARASAELIHRALTRRGLVAGDFPGVFGAVEHGDAFDLRDAPQHAGAPVRYIRLDWIDVTADTKQRWFRADVQRNAFRLSGTQSIRRRILREGFGDVALYLSEHAYGAAIRDSLAHIIKQVHALDHARPPHRRGFVITHSLGSYIFADLLQQLRHEADSPTGNAPVTQRFVDTLDTVYMLANQLLLLEMTRLDGHHNPPGRAIPDDQANPDPGPNLSDMTHAFTRTPHAIQLVDIYDPDDLISYPLTPELRQQYKLQGGSYRLHLTWGWVPTFGLGDFTNYDKAHSGAATDRRVIDFIIDGSPR